MRISESLAHTEHEPLSLGRVLAHFARLAYGGETAEEWDTTSPQETDWSPIAGEFDRIIPFRVERAQGFIAAADDVAVLAFGGTSVAEDWLYNLTYFQSEGFGGRTHKGFADIVAAAHDVVLAGLYDTGAVGKRLWLVGHSLGGALATLAAWRLHDEGFDVAGCVTYGAPPLLNEGAARAYAPPLYRFVNEGDPVPGMHWPRLTHPYVHAGEEVYLLRSGTIAANRYPADLSARIDRAMRFLDPDDPRPLEYGGWIDDHSIHEYERRLVSAA